MLAAEQDRRRTEGVLSENTRHSGGRAELNNQHVKPIGFTNACAHGTELQTRNGQEVVCPWKGQINGHG